MDLFIRFEKDSPYKKSNMLMRDVIKYDIERTLTGRNCMVVTYEAKGRILDVVITHIESVEEVE